MNIHINKHTRLQPWEGRTVFGDYPLYMRPGNFTVALLFADVDAVRRLYNMLGELIDDIDIEPFTLVSQELDLTAKKRRR